MPGDSAAMARHRALILAGVELRKLPRDGDGDGFITPWPGAPDRTPVPPKVPKATIATWGRDLVDTHPGLKLRERGEGIEVVALPSGVARTNALRALAAKADADGVRLVANLNDDESWSAVNYGGFYRGGGPAGFALFRNPRTRPAVPPPQRPADRPAGTSPAPAARPAKKPASDLLDASSRSSVREDVKAVYEGTFAGLDVRVTSVRVSNGKVLVEATIHGRGGGKLGELSRVVGRDSEGNLYAEHRHLELDGSVRGQGFATEFNAALEEWYRESGVDRIEIHADISVGGYAWARAGYDWRDGEVPTSIVDRLRRKSYDADVREMLDRIARGDVPTPYEISQLSVGKDILLGSDWLGVKWL